MQKHLAVYIKFLELQYTIDFFRQYPQASVSGQRQDGEENLTHLLDQILPFCSPDQQNQIRSVSSALKNMAQFQEMAEMMQMMKEMFPQDVSESFMGFSGENGPDPSMLSQIFQLFSQKGEE